MTEGMGTKKKLATMGLFMLCFGYFASYVPFSMMTKMVTRGLFTGMDGVGFRGFEIQPIALIGSMIAMYTLVTIKGWWSQATQWQCGGRSLPRPRWFTLISGWCTAGVIITTIMAYTFSGISIVFAMLLMRGGVLAMAPVVDLIAKKRKRRIYWPSWVAAGLSFGALLVAFAGKAGTAMTTLCAIDIGLYLLSYFIRLFIMSNFAKSSDENERVRYFAEEQLVAMPSLIIVMFLIALTGIGDGRVTIAGQLWYGFTGAFTSGYFWHIAIMGVFSTGAGLFGGLIFLDRRENTFTVPANRSSSIIAGVIATYALAFFYGQRMPSSYQLIGVGLILAAIFFLAYRSMVEKRQRVAAGVSEKTPECQTKTKVSANMIKMQPVTEAE